MKYEYQTIIINPKGFFGGKVNADSFNEELNNMGSQGWELVSAVASNEAYGSTKSIVCIFKRAMQ